METTFQTGRYLWVDQICINQQDRAERSSQVRYMTYIYEKAVAVCVWLGKAGDDSELAFDILRSWQSCFKEINPSGKPQLSFMDQISFDGSAWSELTSSISSERSWNAVDKLINRAWWGRAWVVQEATGPVRTYAMCGKSSLLFTDLVRSLLVGRLITRIPGYPYQALYTG